MKRITLAAGAALLTAVLASPSLAADLPRKAPIYVAPGFSWTGFYVGINGGYGFGKADLSNTFGTESFNVNGALVGGTVGYNLQTGSWVFGLEGDIDYSWIKGTDTTAGTICAGGCEFRNDWFATGRGRIGYAWDRFLPYVTGGAAFGDMKVGPTGGGTETKTKVGWTAGGGIEYAFLGAWSAKVEYLYADLGTATCSAATCGVDTDIKFKTNVVRAGINYRF
jgi:outer membrane immunogenic protein